MLLIKDKWTSKDISSFYKFTQTLKGDDINCKWEQRIINTKLPCYARSSTKANAIAKKIMKGNYLSFLDNIVIKSHLDSMVYAWILNYIKDFNVWKKYLILYIKTIDNWASCDTLKFSRFDYTKLHSLATKLIASKKEFIRRVGINIYFEIYKDKKYAYEAFDIIDSFKDCKQYYVNMVCAWLLSFIYVKYPKETLDYFKHHHTSAFIINKAISKCCDSYRISKKDKEKLKKFKIK